MILLFGYWTPPVGSPKPTAFPRTAHYSPLIVWGTGTGNPTAVPPTTDIDTSDYDDVARFYVNQPGLQVDGIGRDQIRAYSPPAATALDLTLTNWDGRFSPGGPIGNFVGRGPRTTLDIHWGNDYPCDDNGIAADDPFVLVDGVELSRLFDGTVNTVQHTLTRPQRSVQIRALGHLSTLLDKRPITDTLYEGLRTDQAITILLDLVGWPADKRVIDSGDTTILYWWMDGSQTALAMLNLLLGAEGAGGCAYEQAGWFHFEGRQYRANHIRSTEPQWIMSDGFFPNPRVDDGLTRADDDHVLVDGVTDTQIIYDVNPSETQSNPDEVVSGVSATVNQRVAVPQQVGDPTPEVGKVWEYGAPLPVPAGTSVDTHAQVAEPYKQPRLPVEGTDYVAVNPGTGAVLAAGSVTPSFIRTGGRHVAIRWRSNGPEVLLRGDTSNGPQLRAVSLPVASETIVHSTVDTAASARRYSPREHQLDAWPEVTPTQMGDVVNSMCLRYRSERRQATIRIVNLDGRHMQCIMHARISDRIVWMQRHGALNDPYWIEQISHEIAPGGGLHTMVLGCERVYDTVGSRFDVGRFGIAVFGD